MIERFPPDDPREWMNRAHSNLIQARTVVSGVYLEDLCFQAQQAVEKAFKALLLQRGVRFPYVHNLGELIDLLMRSGEDVPDFVLVAAQLTDYAVDARYPGLSDPVSTEEYREQLEVAESVIRWVSERIDTESEDA